MFENKIGTTFTDENSKNWMSNLPPVKRTIPIIYLAIPGSHNTFTYSLKPTSDVSPDSPGIVKKLSHCGKFLVNPIIFKWSKTQNINITQQLNLGIRYLDIRVVGRYRDIFVAHGLYGGPLIPYLIEVNQFLNENPKEAVILDFQHFYKFCSEVHSMLLKNLDEIFGRKLCHRQSSIKLITLDSMASKGEQVLVIYRCAAGKDSSFCWPRGMWLTPWPDKIKVEDLIEYLDAELKKRDGNVGLVTQCILTVDMTYVIKHLCSSLNNMANVTNKSVLPWVEEQVSGPHGINIVICDFVESFDFVKTIIGLNFKYNNAKI